jgi:hypothetical protein
MERKVYKSLSARQAQESNYGSPEYWDYLEQHAAELFAAGIADAYTRSLSQALSGNNGD